MEGERKRTRFNFICEYKKAVVGCGNEKNEEVSSIFLKQ